VVQRTAITTTMTQAGDVPSKAKNNECSVHSNQSKALVNTTVHWLSTEPSKGLLEKTLLLWQEIHETL